MLDNKKVPNHIAMIMDGNRRWARQHNLPDFEGHRKGANNLMNVVEDTANLGIKIFTVYALSTENLKKRSEQEVKFLLSIIKIFLKKHKQQFIDKGIKIKFIGDTNVFKQDLQDVLKETEKTLANNTTITLNIALNYGGRAELVNAIKNIIKNPSISEITEELITQNLYLQDDPDLIIRTGGAQRLSNFLTWQSTYSELYFTPTFWPDFDKNELDKAIDFYNNIERKFGK